VSCLKENFTSSSYGEGLETDPHKAPRQSLTRHQHLSLVIWPHEYVVQDMHLDFQGAKITPLRCLSCRISELQDFIPDGTKPIDCFLVEGLKVFLDRIYATGMERLGQRS
jgi:hypothetical protein